MSLPLPFLFPFARQITENDDGITCPAIVSWPIVSLSLFLVPLPAIIHALACRRRILFGGIVPRKKNLSIAVPAKFIQIVDSFTGLRRRREEGWGGALIVVSNRRRCDYGYSPSKFNYVERSVGIIEPRIEGRTRRWIDTISTSLHHPYRPNFLRQASADELWLVFTCRHRATPSL